MAKTLEQRFHMGVAHKTFTKVFKIQVKKLRNSRKLKSKSKQTKYLEEIKNITQNKTGPESFDI